MVEVLDYRDVSFVRDGREILKDFSWTVDSSERWVVLGPNGAGKTTLLKMASANEYPSSGSVSVLGKELGKFDIFELKNRIGFASLAAAERIPATEKVRDVVLTAAYSVEGRWREQYDDIDVQRANRVLREWQLEEFGDRSFGTLSDGERRRALIARSVMSDPELLLLDEPTASLDLGSREAMVSLLSNYARSEYSPAMIVVTHHVEEIPQGFTHVALIRDGGMVAAGPLAETLTEQNLSETFGVQLSLSQQGGRYAAVAKI